MPYNFTFDQFMPLLEKEAKQDGFKIEGDVFRGWYDRSLGIKATSFSTTGDAVWLRVCQSEVDKINNAVASDQIQGIKKPHILSHRMGTADGKPYSFAVSEFLEDKLISTKGWQEQGKEFMPNEQWWQNTRDTLAIIHQSDTAVKNIDDDTLKKYLKKADHPTDDLPQIQVIHGDFHWGNLGHDGTVYDWERYGQGPTGLDEGILYFYSFNQPELRQKIETVFAPVFETPDFNKSMLMYCGWAFEMLEKGLDVLKPFEGSAHEIARVCHNKLPSP